MHISLPALAAVTKDKLIVRQSEIGEGRNLNQLSGFHLSPFFLHTTVPTGTFTIFGGAPRPCICLP